MSTLQDIYANLYDDAPVDPLDTGLEEVPESYSSEGDADDFIPAGIEDGEGHEPKPSEEPQQEGEEVVESNPFINFLKKNGINPDEITIENENGENEVVSFFDMSEDEQQVILDSLTESQANDLDDNEIEAVNFMRENQLSFNEMVEFIRQNAIKEYELSQQASNFNIDNYTDEEIYALDLRQKFDDLTDEELEYELEKAKENEDLFNKKVNRIKATLKEAHEANVAFEQQEAERIEAEEYEKLSNSLIAAANSIEDIGSIELEHTDKEAAVSLILNKTADGQSGLVKALNDPATLFKVAWFIQNGDKAFDTIHEYYKGEIEKANKAVKGRSTTPVVSRQKASNIPRVNEQKQTFGKMGNITSHADLFN